MDLFGHRLEYDADVRGFERGVPTADEGGDVGNGWHLSLCRRMNPFVEAFNVRE